ncbi:hypothetical protein BHE74_00017818 [Ensete ventricosum]|nr:hypothetical protein GW17_00016404 [Ensete ventricosum]RWW74248.1 hypothetical protein BHE74_00017818 [Ensete ventricosum]
MFPLTPKLVSGAIERIFEFEIRPLGLARRLNFIPVDEWAVVCGFLIAIASLIVLIVCRVRHGRPGMVSCWMLQPRNTTFRDLKQLVLLEMSMLLSGSRVAGMAREPTWLEVLIWLGGIDAYKVIGVMRLCHNFDSIVTNELLVAVRERYNILKEYALHTPLPMKHPYDPFLNGFRLSIDTLEVGLWFPLHPMIEAGLEWWQISPSQMAPNSWHYIVAFLGKNVKGISCIPARHPTSSLVEEVPVAVAKKRPAEGGVEHPKKKTK